MSDFTCKIDQCTATKHEALGLCKKHYTASRPRYTDREVEMPCDGCGQPMLKNPQRRNRYANLYCSRECANAHRFQSIRASRKALVPCAPQPWPSTTPPTSTQPRSKRVFVAGMCRICSTPYLCLFGSATCSLQCQAKHRDDVRREGKHRRRAIQRMAYVARVYASSVFERDDYECQLCGEPLHMQAKVPDAYAPTIDHILALANGGTHEPDNVQSAHFMCNSLKGDREHVFEGPPQAA